MKLENLFEKQILDTTIYAERYLNDSKGSFEMYSEVNPKYDPQGLLGYFEMPFALLNPEECLVFWSNPSEILLNWAKPENLYKFFWHPDVERKGLYINGKLVVQPTSSTRTVLSEIYPRFYLKTDLNKKHFRFIRRLKLSSVEHSINICSDIEQMCLGQVGRYSYLPESLGIVLVGGRYNESGMIYRESIPKPLVQDLRIMLPYHSLYANDPNYPNDKTLLVQLSVRNGANDPLGYFVSEIIGQIFEAWVLMVSKRGLLPELHGQNALIEINENFETCRLVHRDFQSLYSDSVIRNRIGLPLFEKHIVGEEKGTTIESQYSIVFDNMIGKYLLARLAKSFSEGFGIKYNEVTDAMCNYHKNLSGYEVAQFPTTVYKFGNSSLE